MGCGFWFVLASAITAIVHTSPVDWSKEVTVNINTARWTHLVHDKFLSFTLRPETIMNTGQFRKVDTWKSDMANADRKKCAYSKQMLTMAKGLSPAFVRIGGPETNTMRFASSADSNDSSAATITGEQWSKLYQFISDADLDLIVCLNDKHRVRDVWDSGNALELISFSDRHGFNVTWQLGYETQRLNWHPTYMSGVELGRDVVRLRKILDNFPRYQESSIIGPDVMTLSTPEDVRFIKEYITEAGNALTALTWHQHFQNENMSENNEGTEDVQVLKRIMRDLNTRVWSKELSTTRLARKSVWIAEDSPCGETFSDALAWIKRLGTAATLGFQVVMRQPSTEALHHLTPVYWTSLLYKNLVGRAVLDTKMTSFGHPAVQVFSHCTAIHQATTNFIIDTEQRYEPGAVTIFGSNSADENVRLNLKASFKEEEVHVYVLTSSIKNDNHIMTTLMNDKRLVLSPEGKLPMLSPEVQYPGRTVAVIVPARSVFFIVLPTLQARSCMQYLGTTAGNGLVGQPLRAKIKSKVTETETDGSLENHSAEAANSKNSNKPNIKENKDSLLERSITSSRDRLITPSRLRKNRQLRIRNKMNEYLNKLNKDYVKYITFSDNAWLSKFPETNNSQEITEEMMKHFEETLQQADSNHQIALESIRNLNATERRKLYLALIQAVIGKRRVSDESTTDDRDDTDDRDANTDDNISRTRNKNNYNVAATTEDNSRNRIKEDVTEDAARVKRFIEGKSISEVRSQLHSVQNKEKTRADTELTDKILLNKNTQHPDTLLNVQNQVQQNENSNVTVRTTADQNDTEEDYMEEVKMLMESILDEVSTDNSKHNIAPRQLTQFSSDLVKKNDLFFKDDMSGFQELLEAELAPFEKTKQRQDLEEEDKSNFSISHSKHNTEEKTYDKKTVENTKGELEQYNKALTTKRTSKGLVIQDDSEKLNINKESGVRSVHLATNMSPQSTFHLDNSEDSASGKEIYSVNKQNNVRYKRGEPSKNNLSTSLVENLSNITFEEKNRQIYLYLKELAEEGERALKSLYEEMEETNDDNNNDEHTKISVTKSDTLMGNISTVLTLPHFLNIEFSESITGNKNTTKRDTNIKPVVESVSVTTGPTENGSTKSPHPEGSRAEEIKLNLTETLKPDVKTNKEKLMETMMPDNVTDTLPSLSSPSNIQSSENNQEYLSHTPSPTNDKNSDKFHNLNGTMNKYDTEQTAETAMKALHEGVNKEESNKSDISESTKGEIQYSNKESEEDYNKTIKGVVGEFKATETNKAITKKENYSDYHDKVDVPETSFQTVITVNTERTANNSSNNGLSKKENTGNEKSGVIMKIGNKNARRIIGKRDKTDVLETGTYEENRNFGQTNENSTNLDPMKNSLDVNVKEYTVDKAIMKRDDGSVLQEKQSNTNNATNLLDPAMNNLQRAGNQQNNINVVNMQNNDLDSINKKLGLTREINHHNTSVTINAHNIPVDNISSMSIVSENKTFNSNTNMSATEDTELATVGKIVPPLQGNKQPQHDSMLNRKNRMEAFKKRLAEIRERLLNKSGISNILNKRNILIKQKRDADAFSGSDYILTPVSKYIGLNEEDYIADSDVVRDQNDQRFLKLTNSDEVTNSGYKESMKSVADDNDKNRIHYLLSQDDRYVNNFQVPNNDNNLPTYRLLRLLTNSHQYTEQEQQNKCKCWDNSRHASTSDRALLIPVDDMTAPIISDDLALEDSNIYAMIPAVMSGRRFLRSIGNLHDKTDGGYSEAEKEKIRESKIEGTVDTVRVDQINESNNSFHLTNINNDKTSESRKKRKITPILVMDPDDYMENFYENKNIRLKRSVTPIHSVSNENSLNSRSQKNINLQLPPIETRFVSTNSPGTHKHGVMAIPDKLLYSRHNFRNNGLTNKPIIHKRSINEPQLNMKNSIKTLLSTNQLSNDSTSLGESEEDGDSLFDSMLHRTFLKTVSKKKTNGSGLTRLYNRAKQYQKTKPEDDSIETGASLKSKMFGGNESNKLKAGQNNNRVDDKTKKKIDIGSILIPERKTDNFFIKRNQLSDTNETFRTANNGVRVDVYGTDLVMFLIDRIQTLFGFLTVLTGV